MHHSPAGPPPSAVLRAVLADWGFRLRALARPRRLRRVWPVLVVVASVAAVVLAVPALSGRGSALLLDGSALNAAAAASAGSTASLSPAEQEPAADGSAAAGSATGGSAADGSAAGGSPTGGSPGTPLPSTGSPVPSSAAAPSPAPSASSPSSSPAASAAAPTASAPPAAAPAAPAAPAGTADPSLEGQVLALANVERTGAGCAALVADSGLAGVARGHSADMRDRAFFDHVNPSGQDPWARAAAAGVGNARAENIARGQADPAAVMTAWMNSPGHRANVLDCALGTLGVGVAEGPNGPWWTQLFGV